MSDTPLTSPPPVPVDRSHTWTSGDDYEPYVGRWSRLVAREFLAWLAQPADGRWLDVGCGTGAISQAILQCCAPRLVKGIDRSAGQVEHARRATPDERVQFEVGDAQNLSQETGSCDAVVSGLLLNFVPDPLLAVREMRRVLRPGGSAALYVWDYAGRMQMMRHFWNAAVALDPGAARFDEGRKSPLCRPEALGELFQAVGFTAVETRAIDVLTTFRDFADYWTPFLSGQAPAPAYSMSLSAEARAVLRERLRAALPFELDGSFTLIARAWAVKGIKG